jgi:hypothetical protein
MKSLSKLMVLAVLMFATTPVWAETLAEKMPEFPKPTQEHAWLQQLSGEWTAETEAVMEPGKPAVKSTGTESIKSLGEFWSIAEIKGQMMAQPFTGNMVLGYNADNKKYVATWVDSMTSKMWNYEGSIDPSGKVLTLETEGVCPMHPGKTTKFKETLEIKDKDHKVYSSSMLGEDGKWVTMMTSHAHRKN